LCATLLSFLLRSVYFRFASTFIRQSISHRSGEVACFGQTKQEAYLKALLASRFRLPEKNILISLQEIHRHDFIHSAFKLQELGYINTQHQEQQEGLLLMQ
jgi:hypothetical protein